LEQVKRYLLKTL